MRRITFAIAKGPTTSSSTSNNDSLALAARDDDFDQSVFEEWLADYHHAFDAIVLFGTEAVREAAEEINRIHQEIYVDSRARQGTFATRFRGAYVAHRNQYRDARVAIITAMRADIAPETRSRGA